MKKSEPAVILTALADPHRPGGALSAGRLNAALVRYALLFDRVDIPDAQILSSASFQSLASLRGDEGPIGTRWLLAHGYLGVALRDSVSGLPELRDQQMRRDVQGLADRRLTDELERLTARDRHSYNAGLVSAVFKERVLDFIPTITAGRGGVPLAVARDLERYVLDSETLLFRNLQLWLEARTPEVSARARAVITRGVARAYSSNVALVSDSNFDVPARDRLGGPVTVLDEIALPPVLSILANPEILNRLTGDEIEAIRKSAAATHLRELGEQLRRGDTHLVDQFAGVLERLAQVINWVGQDTSDPTTRALVEIHRKSRRRTKLRVFGRDLAVSGVGFLPVLGGLVSTAFVFLFGVIDLTKDDGQLEYLDALSVYRVPTDLRAGVAPVASGRAALQLVMRDNKSGLDLAVLDEA